MSDPPPNAVTVSQLTHAIKEVVEGSLPSVWVSGEVSNFRPAQSGHLYFTLKDEASQIAAVIWRSAAARLGFALKDGMELVVNGHVEVYAARGSYQIIIQRAIPHGVGTLELRLRQLREKLDAEGLFAPHRKRPIPWLPRRIALVTSPTSAAVRDMIQVITRRWPAANIVIVPVAVQGQGAAAEIAAGVRLVPQIPDVDVVIVGRGGGSLEDLWAFNEEIVARAIAACPIPVISAVGHEIDVSISDLVADRRALTPSEAGELVIPLREEMLDGLNGMRSRLGAALRQRAVRARQQLDSLADRRVFTNPKQRIRQLAENVDELGERLTAAARRRLENSRKDVARIADTLNSLSPLAVLGRGYSVTYQCETLADDPAADSSISRGQLLQNASDVKPGDRMLTYLEAGRVVSRVEATELKTEN